MSLILLRLMPVWNTRVTLVEDAEVIVKKFAKNQSIHFTSGKCLYVIKEAYAFAIHQTW